MKKIGRFFVLMMVALVSVAAFTACSDDDDDDAPKGDNKIVGIVATDNIPANIAADPVTSNTYIDKASLKI